MIYGSLFSGIGGFDLGFDRAGMQCAWQVEIDPFCRSALAKQWPDVPKFKDVRNVGRHNLAAVDLICGGFPCQPHSLAGKRRGAEDDRNLWPEYRRIVAELRPRWVVAENVPGIRTTILDEVLSDLEGLDYTVRTVDLPAVAFDAWHRRHRIFIVAHSNSDRRRADEQGRGAQGRAFAWGNGAHDADSDGPGRNGQKVAVRQQSQGKANAHPIWPPIANGEKPGLSNWQQTGLGEDAEEVSRHMAQPRPERRDSAQWPPEPGLARVVYGFPSRLDSRRAKQRIAALGNTIVPVVAQFVGELILAVEEQHET